MATAATVISHAASQIGYQEGRSNGHWNNVQKFAGQVPGLSWAQGQPWCATFVSWCFVQSKALPLLPGGATAAVAHIRDAAKSAGRFSQYPAVGAVAIFGRNGDAHTGIVESYTATTVTTIEGNTNTSGSAEGDGVYRKVRQRRDAWVYGYSYPTYPEGILSADPAWAHAKPKPAPKPVAPKPAPKPQTRPNVLTAKAALERAVKANPAGPARNAFAKALAALKGWTK